MSNGLASLLRNPRRLQQFAETPGNYPAALSFAGTSQSRVGRRASPRASQSEEEAGVLETGEVIDKVKLPDGTYVKPATQSGQIVKVPGRSNLFVDPGTGEPFQADPSKPTGLRSAFETARKVARDGKLFAVVPGVGERELGADPEAEKKAKEQAAKREAENLRLQYAQEKRPYNWDRVAGRPVPVQSDEEWAKSKQEKADKLAEAAAVKKLKAQADKLDIDADRLSLTAPKASPEESAAYDAAVSSLESFAAGKDLDTAAQELANAPDSADEEQNAAKATAQSYLSLRDKVKPAKDAEAKAKELKLRALDLKEQMLDPDAWKAGKAASLAKLPDADLAAEAQAQADIITEQETEAQGTLELVAKGRADLEQKHAAFMAERQAAEAQGLSLEQKQALDDQQAQLEAEMADYDDWNAEAVTSAQGALKASQDRREVLAAAGAEMDRRNNQWARPLEGKWGEMQKQMVEEAKAAGIPAPSSRSSDSPGRALMVEAFDRLDRMGIQQPRFIGQPGEPEGDRAGARDTESLIEGLNKAEQQATTPEAKAKIAKERAYWQAQAEEAMTAEDWASQTGEPDLLYPHEKAAVLEKAKPLYDTWAKEMYSDDWTKEDFLRLNQEAAKHGLDPAEAKQALQTYRQLDWSNPHRDPETAKPLNEKARVLPDGNVTVNPGLLLDPEAYNAAVDEADTTPEAKERAKAMRAELAGPVAAEALKNLRKNSSFAEWLDKNTKGNDVERMEQFNASMKEGGALNAAVMKFLGSTAGLPSGWLGAIAGLTNSDTALDYARYWQDRAQAYQTAAGEAGKGTNMAGRFMASVAGGVPSVMESLAAGGVAGRVLGAGAAALGASAIDAAAQSGGGTFVDAVDAYMQQGLSQEEAKAKAAAPAIASGLVTGVLTALGSGGVESLLRPEGQALAKAAIKRGIMAQVGEGVADESLEEWSDQMMQGIIAQLSYDPNKPLEQVFAEATEAGLVGGVLGGGASGLRGYLDRNAPEASAEPQATAPMPGPVAPAQISQPAQTGDIAGAIKAFTPTGEAMLPQAVADTVKRTNRTTEDVSRAAASGLVKVAQGASLESLDAREREALGFVSKDGKIIPAPKTTPLVENYKGKLVIRNEAAEWLDDEGQPLLARQIRLDEAERKAQIDEAEAKPAAKKKAGQAKEKAAESKPQGSETVITGDSLSSEASSTLAPATISGATEAPKSSQTITGSNAEMAAEMPVQPATAGEATAPTPEPAPVNEPQPQAAVSPEPIRGQVMQESRKLPVVPEQPPAPAQEAAPEPEPAAGGGLTPAQQDQLARAEAAHKKRVETITKMEADAEQRAKQLKAEGMKHAAVKRQITGKLTAKESAAQAKREASNYESKPVAVEGRPAVVTGNAFGKVKVRFEDGTTKAVPASQVTARQEAPPAPVDEASAQAATSPANPAPEPSEAQKEAGNYKKGHAKIGGLDISIENEAGTKRRPEWGALSDHYGYIKGTVDNTGEHADVFIKPGTPEDYTGPVFVVTQNDPKTGKFDEFKTIIGYDTAAEAELAYRANYTADWQGFGGIQEMSLDEFKAGLADMTAREKAAREPGQPVSQAGQAVSEPAPATPLAKAKAYVESQIAQAKARITEIDAALTDWKSRRYKSTQGTEVINDKNPANFFGVKEVNLGSLNEKKRAARIRALEDEKTQLESKLKADTRELQKIEDQIAEQSPQQPTTDETIEQLIQQAKDAGLGEAQTTGGNVQKTQAGVDQTEGETRRSAADTRRDGGKLESQSAPNVPLAKAKAAIADYTAKAKAEKAAAKTQEAKNAANRKIVGAAWLAKRLEAFDGVVEYEVAKEDNGKPIEGMMVKPTLKGGLLVINPEGLIDLLSRNNLGKDALYKAIDKFLVHEFIHEAALSRLSKRRILDLYNALTPEAKAASRRLYLAQAGEGQGELDEFQAAHEWFAQLVEARMSGEISNQALIEASDDPAFRDKLAALFREFVAALRDIAGLVKDPAMAEQIRAEADAVEAAVRQMAEKAGLAERPQAETAEESTPGIPEEGKYSVYAMKDRWLVQQSDKRGFGDHIFDSKEKAVKESLRKQERDRKNAEFSAKQEAAAKTAQEAEEARMKPLNDYLDSLGLSAMQRGKLKAALDASTAKQSQSTGKLYQGPRFNAIQEMVADGFRAESEQVPAIKELTGKRLNRMDMRQEQEYERRRKEAGTTTQYSLTLPSGSMFVVTKAEHDYAKWLAERQAPAPAQPAEQAAQAGQETDKSELQTGDYVRVNGKGPVFRIESIGNDGWVYLANGQGSYAPEDAAKLLVKSAADAAEKEAPKGGFPGMAKEPPASLPASVTPSQAEAVADSPAQAEAKVEEHVQDVAKEAGARPAKDIKAELVLALGQAIKNAETGVATQAKITIQIPGDGTFTLLNTAPQLKDLLKRVRALDVKDSAKPEKAGLAKSDKSTFDLEWGTEASYLTALDQYKDYNLHNADDLEKNPDQKIPDGHTYLGSRTYRKTLVPVVQAWKRTTQEKGNPTWGQLRDWLEMRAKQAATAADIEWTPPGRPAPPVTAQPPAVQAAGKAEAQPASQATAAEAWQGREEAADKPPVGKITDFGEKIFGARKDVWGKFKRIMDQAFPESYDDVTLSRNVPEPDYEAAIEAGVSVDDLALLKAIRDNLPPKPKKSWKLKSWGDAVKFLHQLTQDLIAGKGIDPAVLTGLERTQRLSGLSNAIKLYKYLGYPLFTKAKGWTVANWDVGYYKGQKLDKFTPATIATKDERSTDMLVLRVGEEAWREVAEMIKITLAGQPAETPKAKEAKKLPFAVWQDRRTGQYFVGIRGINGVVRLKTGFPDVKAARQHLADNRADLEAMWQGMKEHPEYRRTVNEPRQGPARRDGDVSPQMFQDAFGFRGVQFGNWVESDRRQTDLNQAYDALMDLAEALGVPPKAMSLDGSLGLAFGARGVSKYKAHYEPGEVVINLTKKTGPGSLAHEWFHAFDNYFARLDDTGATKARALDKYATTQKPAAAPKNMRPEVWQAFRQIATTLKTGPFAERSATLDDARSKPYYSTLVEKSARAFEKYIADRLLGKDITNDYLVNIVKDESPALPTSAEMADGIQAAYDNLFNILDSVPTETGVMLRNPPATPTPLPADEGAQSGLANPPGGQAAVTPAQDAEYMAAVEAGDMAKAQRMVDEAAKAAGAMLNEEGSVKFWLHGTAQELDGNEINLANAGRSGFTKHDLFFLTDSPVEAVAYTGSDDLISWDELYEHANFGKMAEGELDADRQTPYIANNGDGYVYVFYAFPKKLGKIDGGAKGQVFGGDGIPYAKLNPEAERMIDSGDADAVMLQNVNVTLLNTSWPTDHLLVRNGSLVKSADPVTYDESGNVIPLSQRFNPASPSILYNPPGPARQSDEAQAAELEEAANEAVREAGEILRDLQQQGEQEARAKAKDEAARLALANDPKAVRAIGEGEKIDARNPSLIFKNPAARRFYQAILVARAELGMRTYISDKELQDFARKQFNSDPEGVYEWALDKADEGESLNDEEQAVLFELFDRAQADDSPFINRPGFDQEMVKLGHYIRESRGTTGRMLRYGRDRVETPQQRWKRAFYHIKGPDSKQAAMLRIAPSAREKARRIAELEDQLSKASAARRADIEAALAKAKRQKSRAEVLEEITAENERLMDNIIDKMGGVTRDDIMHSPLERYGLQTAILDLPAVREALGKFDNGRDIMRLAFRGFSNEHIAGALQIPEGDVADFIKQANDAIIRPAVTEQVKAGKTFGDWIKSGLDILARKTGLRQPPSTRPLENWRTLITGKRQTLDEVTAEVNRVMGYALQSQKARDSKKLMSKVINTPTGQRVRVFVPFDPDDATNYYSFAREYSAAKANVFDKFYEYWINWPLLSGPQTQVVNFTGNAAQVAWHYTGQRLAEATLNSLVYHDPNSAQLREFWHIMKGFWKSIGPALDMARQSFLTEGDTVRHKFLNEPLQIDIVDGDIDKVGGIRAAVGGKLGRLNRLPGRVLRWTDSFFKTAVLYAEASAVAYRKAHASAKAQGLKGQARRDFIDTEIDNTLKDPQSPVWADVMDTAEELLFQDDNVATAIVDTMLGGYRGVNAFEKALAEAKASGNSKTVAVLNAMIAGAKAVNRIMRFIFPFQRTPTNIIRVGLRKGGGSAIVGLYHLLHGGWLKYKDGTPMLESYTKAMQIKDLSETGIAVMGWLMLASMFEGDDDDEKKPFLIVGSRPSSRQGYPEKQAFLNKYGGESSFVWQDSKGNVIASKSFGRYEPIGTLLTTWVDAYRNFQEVRRRQKAGEAASFKTYMLSSFVSGLENKSFLQGLSNIMEWIRDIEERRENPDVDANTKLFLRNVVPNIIKQPMRNWDEVVRETKTAGAGYSALPNPALSPKLPTFAAEPKISTTGQKMRKDLSAPARLLFPANTVVTPQPDALLYRANRLNPTAAKWPSGIQRDEFFYRAPGAKPKTPGYHVPIEDAAGKRRFAEMVGQEYTKEVRNYVASLPPALKARPGPEQIEGLAKAMTEARKKARILYGLQKPKTPAITTSNK